MEEDYLRPGQTGEDAPGQVIIFDGVRYVLDESGHSAELAAAMARKKKISDEIAAEMREACLETSPYGNPYKS